MLLFTNLSVLPNPFLSESLQAPKRSPKPEAVCTHNIPQPIVLLSFVLIVDTLVLPPVRQNRYYIAPLRFKNPFVFHPFQDINESSPLLGNSLLGLQNHFPHSHKRIGQFLEKFERICGWTIFKAGHYNVESAKKGNKSRETKLLGSY